MILLVTVLGIVQGVGYRPFVARLAKDTGITGTVQNNGGVVHIQAQGDEE
jgi:hydrogenase maturation protein HypF